MHTTIVMAYEERTTGNKPEIEKKFFQVSLQKDCAGFLVQVSRVQLLQMMETNFSKTKVPFEKLDKTFRSQDIHVVLFSLKA